MARERTRVLERESIIVQQREDVEAAVKASRKEKGKAKSTRFENDGELEERYKEVVEEKKGRLYFKHFEMPKIDRHHCLFHSS